MYSDVDETVVEAVVGGLRKLADKGLAADIVAATLSVAADDKHAGRACAIKVIGALGSHCPTADALAQVRSALKCRQRDVRCAAAVAIGRGAQFVGRDDLKIELYELARSGRKAVRAAAIGALAAVVNGGKDAEAIDIINTALAEKDRTIRIAAAQAAARFGTNGKPFVPNLLSDVREQVSYIAPNFPMPSLSMVLRLRRSFRRDRNEDRGRSSLLALEAIGLHVETERIEDELSRIAEPEQTFVPYLPAIIATVAHLGAKTGSVRSPDLLLKLISRYYETITRFSVSPVYIIDAEFLDAVVIEDNEPSDFISLLLSVAQRLESNKASKSLKSSLESNQSVLRILALAVIAKLSPGVASDLLPTILRRATDENARVREKSWEVTREVYERRNHWRLSGTS
jgi:hypothetical protein